MDEENSKEQLLEEIAMLRQYQQIVDSASIGIRVIDKDFNTTFVNHQFKTMLGLEDEEIIGKKCYDTFYGPCCHNDKCPLTRIIKGERFVEKEADKVSSTGKIIACLVSARPMYDKRGNMIGIIEDFKDITLIKDVERTLKENEEKLKSYIDESPEGIFIVDGSGRYLDVNPAGCRMYGYSKEELLKLNISNICFYPKESINKVLKFGKSKGLVTVTKKDGTKIFVDIHRAALGNNRYIGFARDVTKEKAAELSLVESERNYDIILNGISDTVILFQVEDDQYFKFVKVNKIWLETVGFKSEKEVLGKLVQDAMPEEVSKRWNHYLRETLTSKKNINMIVEDDFGIHDVRLIPIINTDEKCTHVIAVTSDITEKKKLEDQLFKMDKIESIGFLAGGIAHDFNNILTVIMGNISLAKMKLLRAQERDFDVTLNLLNEAEKGVIQAKNLTYQLLTFAKGGDPILKTTSIEDLLQEAVNFALRGSNVKCRFNFDKHLWPAEIDPGQINQVIHNLILNANQAMPMGGTIQIEAENKIITSKNKLPLKTGNYIRIVIKDQGIGSSQENLDKIFDPFFTTKVEGNGLGLTSTYSIIKKHDGYISVDSEIGKGTSFYIYLPASQKELVRKKAIKEKRYAGKGRVLIMDDEEALREVLKEIIVSFGYEVACAKDGEEAIHQYVKAKENNKVFDAVIMDLTVPGGMGGKEAIKELSKLDPKVKAIVSSGYSNDPIMAYYKEHGFKAVVNKPFTLEELGKVLRKVIK